MKYRPILFSELMVRAILDGRKTQTRRIVKDDGLLPSADVVRIVGLDSGEFEQFYSDKRSKNWLLKCPYGRPGDRLWVRETFALVDTGRNCVAYKSDELAFELMYDNSAEWPPVGVSNIGGNYCAFEGPWKPSIFMPRWASRITLEIVSVRVERLQDISEEDCIAEGVRCFETEDGEDSYYAIERNKTPCADSAIEVYAMLWDSINGPGSWVANPWVWVIDFRKTTDKSDG